MKQIKVLSLIALLTAAVGALANAGIKSVKMVATVVSTITVAPDCQRLGTCDQVGTAPCHLQSGAVLKTILSSCQNSATGEFTPDPE